MKYAIDETELARLEELACAAGAGDYSAHEDADANAKYAAAACNAVPALIAEVRRLREALNTFIEEDQSRVILVQQQMLDCMREKVEAWEWLFEVIEYDVYEDHHLAGRWGYADMSDNEREAYTNARVSHASIEKAAREAVHADRE